VARSHAALRAAAFAPTAAGRAAQVSSVPEPTTRTGLRANVLGLGSSITIGVSSAAPAYSLAAVLAVLAGSVGLHAPAALLLAFIPMVCTAAAYNAFDRIAPDAGSVFAWLWRTVGPRTGWIAGWALIVANVVVMASLGEIAGRYTFLLAGWTTAAQSDAAVTLVGVMWIGVVTAICYVGIHVSARAQRALLSLELLALVLFSVVALARVLSGHAGVHAATPQLAWFSPVGIRGHGALAGGVLAALFIFWGWDTTATVAEETRDPGPTSGRAALLSTVILLAVFLLVVTAAQAFDGPGALAAHPADALSALATGVLGHPFGRLVVLAVLTSAIASAQTSVLPAARTVMAMAHAGATPPALGRIHPRHHTPHIATLAVGIAGATLFTALSLTSQAVLSDSIAALGLIIAFYYGLAAFACPIYFRRELLRSPRKLLTLGLVPLIGAGGLAWVLVRTAINLSHPANSATHTAPLGIGLPLLLTGCLLLLGLLLLGLTAWRSPSFPAAWTAQTDPPNAPRSQQPTM
jgi:amino acid transporter